MIDINLYRSRIGNFNNCSRKPIVKFDKLFKCKKRKQSRSGTWTLIFLNTVVTFMLVLSFLQACPSLPQQACHSTLQKSAQNISLNLPLALSGLEVLQTTACFQALQDEKQTAKNISTKLKADKEGGEFLWKQYITIGMKQTSNFKARCLHGNPKRGIKNMHVNIRSLYNKMGEVKNMIQKEKPHILGISEAELRKNHHSEKSLKVPGYELILPKSWEIYGKARVVLYIKKSLAYDHLPFLEHPDIQSIWIRAGFKNTRKIYYSHIYREHTNTLGNSMAAQRTALERMLAQWEDAIVHENPETPNEVHIAGDMNLDSLKNRWLQPDYSLYSLATMVMNCCNSNNFSQMVNKVTRVQYNSNKNKTAMSCIDHLYCNAKHRISVVDVVTCGTSDHDAITYTRYTKEPKPPAKTIRKRSYKNFCEADYLRDISRLDFTDVYCCVDVDDAAEVLTSKLVDVLNVHAPWILFQQRKHFVPWLTPETVKLMEQRDEFKEQAKNLANFDGQFASPEQAELWGRYKKLRNKINNKNNQEEIRYKKNKVNDCKDSPTKAWGLAKKFMDWTSPGPPTQLEVKEGKKITLYTKAKDLARVMNEYFISKVQTIVNGLKDVPSDLNGCKKVMEGRNISLSMKFVTVAKVRKLLVSLKNKTSTSIDQLDNYSVKLAADYIAGPLHHVITLSIMQQKFPSGWKLTKIVPLHKKESTSKRENYRPVAILSPLSKVLEKVMYELIYSYFDRNKLFHPSLHGYRKDRSTMTALLSMYDKWVHAASKGQLSGVVLVDLSAAFDLVSPSLLVEKMKVYGFEEDITTWILSYLTDRYQSVWIDHVYSDYLENSIGVPQGSNLGPLFFLIFFNDLPTYLREDIDCYADDSTLGATAKEVEDIGTKLSRDCGQLSLWMQSNSFKLNAGKTHFLTMGTSVRIKSMEKELVVVMDGVKLKETVEKSETLLGVKIQSDLKWSQQVEELTGKLKKRLAGLEKLKYVMNRFTKKNIVEGVFNSVLCYCLPLFGGCNKSELSLLQVQQNRAAQVVLNLPPRTSRDTMFNKLGWLTVQQLTVYHTLITVFRIKKSREPEHLASILGKENIFGHIVMKNTRLGLYRDSFIFRGATSWNKLPMELRVEEKISKFKRGLKSWVEENVDRFAS